MNSILNDVRKMMGMDSSYTYFDQDLIIYINSVLDILKQLGIGIAEYFYITDGTETWEDLFDDSEVLNIVKNYIYLKVRMNFDPPSGATAESFKNLISEYEWRVNMMSYK